MTLCRHIAFVMDGNGRWAEQKNLPRSAGHEAGADALFEVLKAAQDLGVKWVTVFSFSTENWRRPQDEVDYLLNFNKRMMINRRDELHERGVRIRFIGNRRDKKLTKGLTREMSKTEELTKENENMDLIVAFNYGGRDEIVRAVKELFASGSQEISEDALAKYLFVPEAPDPDLVVRTSGESRISNFLLWQIAYSELVFSDVLWPDFGPPELKAVLEEFDRRERRYGGLN